MCDAHIRPFRPINDTQINDTQINDTQINCGLDEPHYTHQGILWDYAYPGSATTVEWLDDDRRNFFGDWPGDCPGCILPLGHQGRHAT